MDADGMSEISAQKEVPSDLEELYLQRQNPSFLLVVILITYRKKSQVILKNYTFNGKIQGYKVLMEPVVLNRERAAADCLKRMPILFDDYRDEDFYGLPRKYSIVARVEVKFPIEPRFRDRQHFVLSDINGAKIEAITYMYETVKHFDNLLHEKHVYKMHNVKFSLHPGEFNFRHLNGPMELCLDQQTIVEPYTVPIQMAPFPKQILLNLADIAELPNRTLVDIMAVVVHLDTIHRTMWGPFRKIVIMDARGYLHIIKVWGDLLNKNALRWALAKEDYGIIIGTMFRRFRRQECLESSDHTAIHFNPFHHNTHHFRRRHRSIPFRLYKHSARLRMDGFFMENGEPTETDQMEHNDGRTPLTNISNTITIADENGSKRLGPNVDAKELSLSDGCSTIDFTNFATQVPNVNRDDDSDWLHRNETFKSDDVFTTRELLTPGGVHETVGNTPNHNLGRAAYFRERYKNLTPAERELNRERLRLYNNTPKRKGSKIEYIRKRRALLADTLSQESIAMESPTYTPEVVHPTTDAIEPNGSALTPCDWVIPDIASNPFLPASTQTEDADSLRMSTRPLRRKQHVPRGERQAILARRNRQFEASISRNMATVAEDIISDAEEGDDRTQPHMTAKINNNVDDDDGVVFEDDADENEGYLFAGQYEDTDEDIEIDGSQDESSAIDVPDPYDKVYSNIPEETHMLKTVPNCGYCTAKKFEYETPGFCCRGGKVELAPLETPPQLKRLWDSADSDARHFRDNIRFFNGHFSFTSLYCCLDSMTTNVRDSGIYTFRAQGMMYHNIKSFGRDGGAEHKHLELYFYDDDPTLEHRYRKCREEHQQKDKEVIRQIVDILRGNPYSEHLRTMGHVENLDDYRIALNLDQTLNQKTYNTPLTSEVAAVWIEGSEGRGQFSKSVMLHGKDSSSHCIRSYHGCYDALSYPLFFPRGELGWHANIPKVGVSMDEVDAYRATHRASNANDEDAESPSHLCVSVRDYYCYKFQIRPGVFNPILHGKRLFQQFAVDTYIKIENSRLDYIRKNQDRLRADLYQGLVDSMLDGDIRGEKVGKRTVLSTSFIGGPRDMRRRYMDAMALVRKFGKPDIFLTMTCNPNWDEIRRELLPGQTPQDRPDLVVRVFHAKLQELKHRLTKQDILGKVRAYVYVVEFQKRGLPHAHFLLIMQRKYKLTCPEQYDLLISAEIPSNKYPELRKMVIKHMMHGPCGSLNPNCPCTKGRKSCKNHYPRPFSDTTLQGKDSYPIYRRRDDDRKEKVRGCELDNRWVVPYNPYLLRLFNCHINVEACGSIKAVKYLFKYIYKGHDRASVVMRDASKADDDVDEIKQYRDARWVTPPEALWRIYGFELSQISPPVMQLQLHLPNMHMVAFHERQMVERVVNRPGVDRSMLTSYFEANRLHEEARGILYRDFPEWYTWQSGKGKVWQRRKRDTGGQVGRIVSAHPAEGERYYLRVLLNHVTGAASYVDLRTVDGVTLPTFREAAERRGLLESDNTLDECLTERALFQMPSSLRRLFATILVYCEPSDVAVLWQKHKDSMSEDYQHKSQNKTHVEQMVLIDIRNMLQSMGKDIKTFPLPPMIDAYDDAIGTAREVYEEESIQPTVEDVALKDSLNEEQRAAYDKIMSAVDTDQDGLFFVDGPGGTGKTYLYRVLLATLRNQGKIAVATATSGVAASIMPGGRTAHSRFKIPLTIDDGVVCSFTKQSGTAELLQKASLIIWDEASMTKRQAVEALDNSMRDIMGRPALPFGGKTIVFGGDFRQVLPVVRKGSRAQVVASSLRMSYLWESMSHLKLVSNMRAKNDPWFAEFLLRVGGGTEETNSDGDIRLPDDVCVPYSGSDNDLDNLIDFAFPNLNENMSDSTYITSRAILSTRNDWVDMINVKMIDRFQGEHMVYHSFDSAMDDPHNYYPPEFLNTLTPNGLPPHVLKLKIGCPVILLRNIDPANGLCNGTRLVVRGFQRNSIDAEIVLGQHVGKRIFLPRIPLCPSDEEMFPFQFKRKQFPVRLSFAMTVNKAQGQTIPNVGVYLPEPVFSHGQLYVALSRATARSNIKILVIPAVDGRKKSRKGVKKTPTVDCGTYTKNIVYKEEIPCEPRVEVVLIDDAFVERKWMECLFQPSAYLGDEVIDCYINLIKAQKHLKCRSGGRVHIENAFQFNFLKRDGDLEIKTEELYPIKDMTHICSAERRVLLYLDHDMVFIPINIRETHWYLAVIHARNMEIQVLDSLGTSQDRKDLTDSIKGLQRQIDMISQRKELKDHRWPDLQVASWPLREIDMGYAKQTDSSSCGLFLLNYIEYWTGDELSDSFTQDDMSHFRKKMAAILLSSDLNKRRGCLLYKNEKEVDSGSPSDVEILENPTDSNKRKLLHVLDDSEVVFEDEEGPITQADLQRWFVDDWDKRAPVKVSNDCCTNDFLMVGLSTKDMPVTKADSIDVLCDYIMAIEDDTTLERTWVRSFNPFKIEISVKDLQNILTTTQDMILRCFDMAVRLLANKESRKPKEEIINNRKHYMDMRFWRMVGFGKLPKYHQDPTTEELAKTLDCWPSMNYYITGCRYVLMPWKFNGCHALFVIDHVKKHVTFIDFTPTQDWCKHMPYKRFAEAIIMASKKYKIAYSKKRSGWAEDIFKWEHTIQTGVPIDLRGYNTSYLVLQAMAMWGNDRRLKFVGDAKTLRRNFVIDLLSYEDNSCRYAIPANIQQRLVDIAKKD
ncbi:ATP-dependent DNA helicase PIF1 [Zea mays]|uniref:ATP-dependent DNA helicase n=1 Tax=Zea mays TaxID=4577 RepID=A0A3L6G808_MAIZE|nr:ATP-dependent DNA helicase PIF1 [Zea mays]